MRVNDGASRTAGAGGAGQSSAAAAAAQRAAEEARRAAEAARRAAEEARRAAAEAARAQGLQAAQAQQRADAAARSAQEAQQKAQAALGEARKHNLPQNELRAVEQSAAQAATSARDAMASARGANSRTSSTSSFVPASTTQRPMGPPAPATTPGYTREQAARDATEIYRATKGGLTGWGTEEDKIFKTLEGRNPADIALIRQSFKEHYNLDMDKVLREELGGDDLTRVNGMLAGNKGNAGAAAIQQQTGWFGDKDAIIRTLQQATPSERQSIARSFQQMYAEDHRDIQAATPEEFMKKALASDLDGAQEAQLDSLLATTQATAPAQVAQLEASAARSKVHDSLQGFFGPDSQRVFDTLEDLPPEQKEILLADTALQAEMQQKLSKEDYTRARGLLEGNSAAASAAQINSATQGWFGADKDAILDVLENTKPEDMPALKAEFQRQTNRSLESEVRGWGGDDAAVGLRYLNPPAANDRMGQARADAERLHRAMDGLGTDEAALREVLGNKSKAQINDITTAYRELYKKDLRADLDSELGGRDEFEVLEQMYDQGAIDPNAPDAAQQQLQRLREQQQFEQSGGLGVINTLQTWTKGESDAARLDRNLNAAEAAISSGNTDAANRRLGYSTDDVKDVQETKDSTADMAATAAVAVVTTAAVVATGGAATPLAVGAYAALGAGTRMATQAYFKGDALGTDGLLHQGALGAVEGGTAVIPLPKGLGGTGTAVAASEVTEQAVKQTVAQRLRGTAIQGAWEGGVGGATSGALDQAMQSETWRNGVMSGLSQVGQRAVVDGTVGSVFGAGGGAAMDGVMQGASRLAQPREVPVVRNPTLEGSTVRVRYGDGGRVQIEAGPRATSAQIQAHMETARTLQKYEGPLGQVRQLRDRAMQALTRQPGYGTQGFESQLEVKKLKSLISELEGVQRKIDTRLHSLDNSTRVPTAAQRADMERELESLRKQLATHEQQVNSLDPARGFVAAEDLSKKLEGIKTELAQRLPAERANAMVKISGKMDFEGNAAPLKEIEDAWSKAYSQAYEEARRAGDAPKAAGNAARQKAKEAATVVANDVATRAARTRADKALADPSTWNLRPEDQRALNAFTSGSRGMAAKQLSPQLSGLPVAQIEARMMADVSAGRATRLPDTTLPNGKPQQAYQYSDGTLVRVKPQGDQFTSEPSYSIEVLADGVHTAVDQNSVAFKLDAKGQAVPKGPGVVPNPYDRGTNPIQAKAFELRIVEAGHLRSTEPSPTSGGT
ncbi:hypothetical protein JQX13_51290 [Archangium violaceum]|uniref:annexin n=1 Tax=Archangium violaceum TaxID=83451 RepID=UPI00193B06C9|nr:annexin [Archangium violaceum]QRK08227.1 hypothetical protein JQX13_51290 [Archangium violaceum]